MEVMYMIKTEIIAQAIGILAMVFHVLSYQGKKQSTVIAFQLVGSLLFAVNFFMLGAVLGGILDVIAAIRAVIFLFKDKFKADKPVWLYGFVAVYIASYILNFTLLGKEPTITNFVVELLPVIGMTALNIGFRMKKAADIRKMGLISSPAWLVYNIVVGSIGASICETIALISIFVGMIRHDKGEK